MIHSLGFAVQLTRFCSVPSVIQVCNSHIYPAPCGIFWGLPSSYGGPQSLKHSCIFSTLTGVLELELHVSFHTLGRENSVPLTDGSIIQGVVLRTVFQRRNFLTHLVEQCSRPLLNTRTASASYLIMVGTILLSTASPDVSFALMYRFVTSFRCPAEVCKISVLTPQLVLGRWTRYSFSWVWFQSPRSDVFAQPAKNRLHTLLLSLYWNECWRDMVQEHFLVATRC